MNQRGLAVQVLLGVGCALAAWLLRLPMSGLLGGEYVFITFFPALACASFFSGLTAGISCTAASAMIVWIWLYPPTGSLRITSAVDLTALILFALTGLFLSGLGQLARHSRSHQEARSQSEQRYRTLFQSIDEGFCVIQMIFDDQNRPVDYRFLEANAAWERHTGLRDGVGRRVRQLVPDLDESWFRIYGDVALTGQPHRFINHAPAMNRWFDVYAFPIGDPRERKVALLFTDITERKRAQDALRESERRLAEVFENAPAFMAVLRGPDLVFESVNRAYQQLIGDREIVGKPVVQALPEVRGQGYLEVLRKVLETGQTVHGRGASVRLSRAAGAPPEERIVDFVYQPLREPDGSISGVLAHGVDLTDRVSAERALRESEEKFRTLANSIPQLAWMAHPDGSLFWFNQRWYEYTGTTPESQVGWGWQSAHDPAVLPRIKESWMHAVATGQPWEETFPLRRHDGEYRDHLSRAMPLRDTDGRIVLWFGTNTDISEQKRAEDELRRANNDLLQFASIASHDLKEPLRGIAMLSRFVAEDEAGRISSDGEARLSRIQTLCERLTTMVNGLIEHARTGLEPRLEECDLNQVVLRVVDTFGEELAAGACEVIVRGQLPVIRADAMLMERVFANLISNAMKFNESPAKLAEIFWDGSAVVVRDNGLGIDERYQEKIFRIFRRVHNVDRYPGAGLGLALTKKIIEAHGGRIELQSALGRGTTFRLFLPVLSPGAAGPELQTVAAWRERNELTREATRENTVPRTSTTPT